MVTSEPQSGVDFTSLHAFLRESGLDDDDLRDIFDLFLEDAPGHIRSLNEAVASGDSAAVATAAHALKSPAALICAGKLAAQLADMEEQARCGESTPAWAVDAVATELDRITRDVRNGE